MKKIFLVTIFILIALLTTGCTDTAKNEIPNCNIGYMTNDKENVTRSFCYSNGIETEITVDGYSEIWEAVYYKGDMYCFGKKDGTFYAVCCTDNEVKSICLRPGMDILYRICFYNDKPIFMSMDEKDRSVFYSLDFDTGKYYVEMYSDYDDCLPLYYFTVSNKLVLFYAISDMSVSEGNSNGSFGVICYYDGKINKIGSGFSPIAYNGNVVYKTIENSCNITYEYEFNSNKSVKSDIEYFSGIINPSNCFDIEPICVNEYVFYADDYNIYYCKINESKMRKLKHFSKAIICGFNVN